MNQTSKHRLEAFSDGVFAISITLLIVPLQGQFIHIRLSEGLLLVVSSLFTYIMSFIVIGIYWLNHHNLFDLFQRVNPSIVWLNMLHLLFISLIAVFTALAGQNPWLTLPAILYGSIVLLANISSFLMLRTVSQSQDLREAAVDPAVFKRFNKFYFAIAAIYGIAILSSFIQPIISYTLYLAVNFLLIISSFKSEMHNIDNLEKT